MLMLETGSRHQSRLSIHIPAIVTTSEGTRQVTLIDLSLRGARLAGRGSWQPRLRPQLLLQWQRFQAVGEICWVIGPDCGVRFLRSIQVSELFETRDLGGNVLTSVDREVIRRNAEAFLDGRVRL